MIFLWTHTTRKLNPDTRNYSYNILKSLNIGCGSRFHPSWVNVDVSPQHKSVIRCDVDKGIPYPAQSFDVVYHAHVLEHFEKQRAPQFLRECFRVLKPGGVIRVVVPDVEQITRLYLQALERAATGEQEWHDRYEWMMLEMYDQTVRNQSGGDMLRYLMSDDLPDREFIRKRCGLELEIIIRPEKGAVRSKVSQAGGVLSKSITALHNLQKKYSSGWRERIVRKVLGPDYHALQVGRFRKSGEVHQWMYDRYSLAKLLVETGFVEPEVMGPAESTIPNWTTYNLDTDTEGLVCKPDSLYMEAVKS